MSKSVTNISKLSPTCSVSDTISFCNQRTNKSSSKDSKIISTVIGLVLSFVICWTPFQLRNMVYHVTISHVTTWITVKHTVLRFKDTKTNLRLFLTFSNLNLSADLCLILSESSNVFVSLNCFLNPVIYGFLNTAYRQSIIRTEISDVCRQKTGKYGTNWRDWAWHCVTQNKENLNWQNSTSENMLVWIIWSEMKMVQTKKCYQMSRIS